LNRNERNFRRSGSTVPARDCAGWRDLDGIAARYPSLDATHERKHALDAPLLEGQGHARTGGFVRACAVQHDVAVTGNVVVARVQILRVYANRSWQDLPGRLIADRRPQVEYAHRVAGLKPESQLIRCEASATQRTQDATLLDDAPRPVGQDCPTTIGMAALPSA